MLAADPVVTVDTNFGNFQIELRPDAAPQTVANFLGYAESGAYTNTVFHRSVPGFVEQTGGFTSASTTFTSTSQFTTIPTNAAVPLEYSLPNIAGSVAMARTSDPNSATDEWFVNLADNSTQLGPNGSDQYGYTVFGQVLGNGMQVLDSIAALSVHNADNATFSQLPLGPNNELVRISSVTIDSIDGTVFSDTNVNGTLDSGEQGVAARTMFVDLNGTGVYQSGDPTATTDSSGNYSFSGITPGTYKVYEELPASISLTMPSQTVTVAANQTASAVNFAEPPSIKGTVFNDANDNGILDTGETGVAGRTVVINNDGTGVPDEQNPSTVTDANGNYSFSYLAPGSYTLAIVTPSGATVSTTGLTATVTAGGSFQTVNIGEVPPAIAGTVFTDVNGNGQFDTGDVGIAGRTVFIDQDGSGTADGTNPQTTTDSVGNFSFSGISPGTYTVDEVLPSGGTLTTQAQTVTVKAGQTSSGVVFGELPSISGTVFIDVNGNGGQDTGEPGAAGQTVFLDIDGSGAPDSTNPSTTTDSNGNFAFGTEPAGSYTVKEVLPSNVNSSTPSQGVTVAPGKTTTGVALGELPAITGTVFSDTNGNAMLDSGETGVAGRTVFLNIDGTGTPDASNPSTTTDANGNYFFLGLAAGSYPVTEVLASGITLTTQAQTVTVVAGQTTSGINLGEKATATSEISGTVFGDINFNGQLDSDETGIAGRTVFLNVDGSGKADGTNPQTTTDAGGKFSFTGLAAGTYTVDEAVGLEGSEAMTSQPVTLALTTGQKISGVMIGDAELSTVVPIVATTTTPVASTDPNVAFLNALYQAVLGRAPDAASLSTWQQQLASGTSRAAVAQDLWDSTEHRTMQVEQFYEDFLNRPAEPAGLQYWVDSFGTWGNEQLDAVHFLGSPEFQSTHTSNTSLVDALYNDVEMRAADPTGESYWVGQLASGTDQTDDWYSVIADFVFGQETSTQTVDSFYSDYLHRAPDSTDLQTAINALTSRGETADQLAIGILSSDEFYGDATANQAPAFTSDSSANFPAGAGGSFVLTASGSPAASITETDTPPAGITLGASSNGSATLTVAPTTAAGSYSLKFKASNGIAPDATQTLTITIA